MKCNYKVGKTNVRPNIIENAFRIVAKEVNLKDGLMESFKLMPKGVTLEQWTKFFEDYVKEQKRINKTEITAEQVGLNPSSRATKKLVDFLNLKKHIYKVKGQTYYSLSEDTVAYINATKARILRDGALDEDSIQDLLDIIENVVDKEEVVSTIHEKKSKILKAIDKKLGDRLDLKLILKNVFSIDPYLIKEAGRLGELNQLYEMLTENSIVLQTGDVVSIKELVIEIIEGVTDNFESEVEALEVDPNDEVEKANRIKQILANPNPDLSKLNPTATNWVRSILPFIDKASLELLDNKRLRIIQLSLDSIERGILPYVGQTALLAIRNQSVKERLVNTISKLNPSKRQRSGYSDLRSFINKHSLGKKTTKLVEYMRGMDLARIDARLGNHKDLSILEYTLNPLALAISKVASLLDKTQRRATEVRIALEEEVKKKGGLRNFRENLDIANAKIKAYQLQIEAESNPGEVGAATRIKIISKKGRVGNVVDEGRIEALEDILKEFGNKEGEIDSNKLFDALSPAEKKAVAFNLETSESDTDALGFISGSVRNTPTKLLSNSVHHHYLSNESSNDPVYDAANDRLRKASAKASILNDRDEYGGATAIVNFFDPLGDTVKHNKLVQLDAHLTPEIQKIKGTMKLLKDELASDTNRFNAIQKEIVEAMDIVFDEKTDWIVTSAIHAPSKLGSFFKKGVYTYVLGTIERVAAEWISNPLYLFAADSVALKKGATSVGVKDSALGIAFAELVGSQHLSRLFTIKGLTKEKQANVLSKHIGMGRYRPKGFLQRNALFIYDLIATSKLSTKGDVLLEQIDDWIMAGADIKTGRIAFFGRWEQEIKKATNKDLDIERYVMDAEYRKQFEPYIKDIQLIVDDLVTSVGTAQNEALSPSALQQKYGEAWFIKGIKEITSLFASYNLGEVSTYLQALGRLTADGVVSKTESVGRITGIYTRQISYNIVKVAVAKALATYVWQNATKEEEEELKSKDYWLVTFIYELMASLVTLNILKNSNHLEKFGTTALIEEANALWHEWMEIDYGYETQVVYRKFQLAKVKRGGTGKAIIDMLGVFKITTDEVDKVVKSGDPIEALLLTLTLKKKLPFGKNMIDLYRKQVKWINTHVRQHDNEIITNESRRIK